ncbi:MAG TPA: tail fiber domain-containing protein, partial [Thermoanaerobaculia bacterium]|nr:tail fiber domain-containing protein [Thermoanaerobaculia bacterium]
ILEKIEAVPVVTYDFKNGGAKNRMGLIAEDFYTVFGRGDDKHIDGQDVQMALWLAVQQLTEKNKELTDRLATLEKQLSSQQKQ